MLSSLAGVLFDGFAYGMLLFLLSVGLSVTLGMMNFVNLAHCSFAMVGGYVTVSLVNRFGWPFLATLPAAFLAAGLGGAAAIEIVGLDHAFALNYLVYVLIVVAVGGLGSIGGSFAAALVLGISDMAGKYYFPWLGAFLIYLVMVALLMWRPVGLFGKR